MLMEESDPMQPAEICDSLSPLNTIRTETVLSKFPVHNLAKKGRVDIRIVRHASSGAVELKWEVSHSDRYGQPRQLAYKLDTLVVNRRLDEEGRPLPQIIRIGSLKEVCRHLGMQESGKNTRDLRTSFLQNATAFINAQITYRTVEGAERRLEAGFTRYGVVFTGEKLPDGQRADAVYITLNTPYWEVVNSAPIRPLDYDYLKALNPAAQRFYEIVSFRVYAAIKNGWPTAKLSYSDYCAFSAQQRYFDYERVRVQMYKIHKPHLASGYLKSVTIHPGVDGEGKSDWLMTYAPGPKARIEFRTFTEKSESSELPATLEQHDTTLLLELTNRGISQKRASELLNSPNSNSNLILDQLEWGDFLLSRARPGTFRNPPGFYIWLITEDIRPPESFETSRIRNDSQTQCEADAERQNQLKLERSEYESWRQNQVDEYIQALDPAEYSRKLLAKEHELSQTYRNLPGATLSEIARAALSRDLAGSLPILTFEDFKALLTEERAN
jgi:hypothetical protein